MKVLLAGVLAVAALGCSGEDRSQTVDAENARTIEELVFAGERRNELAARARKVTESCMRDRGWPQFVGDASYITDLPSAEELATADEVMAYGIGYPDPPAPAEPNRWLLTLSTSESERFRLDLWVDQPNLRSCATIGHIDAFGNAAFISPGYQEMMDEVSARAEADEATSSLYDEWSKCMAQSGYSYRSPNDAINGLFERYRPIEESLAGRQPEVNTPGLLQFRTEQHEIFAADRGCRERLKFDDRMSQIRDSIGADVLAAHPEVLSYLLES